MLKLGRSLFMIALILIGVAAGARPNSPKNRSVTIQNSSGESLDFLIQVEDDGSVAVIPQLKDGQEGSFLVGRFDRGRPAKVEIPGYRAEKIFRLGEEIWITLREDESKARYLARVVPQLEKVTIDSVAGKMVPDLGSALSIGFLFYAYFQDGGWPFLAMGAVSAGLEIACRVRDVVCELKRRFTQVETEGVHKNPYGEKLRVVRYLFNPDWSVRDVVLQNDEGLTYSLKTRASCAKLLGRLGKSAS